MDAMINRSRVSDAPTTQSTKLLCKSKLRSACLEMCWPHALDMTSCGSDRVAGDARTTILRFAHSIWLSDPLNTVTKEKLEPTSIGPCWSRTEDLTPGSHLTELEKSPMKANTCTPWVATSSRHQREGKREC
jgi:hypothetical protein